MLLFFVLEVLYIRLTLREIKKLIITTCTCQIILFLIIFYLWLRLEICKITFSTFLSLHSLSLWLREVMMQQECVGEEGGNGWWTGDKIRMCVCVSGRAEWGLSRTALRRHNKTYNQTFPSSTWRQRKRR